MTGFTIADVMLYMLIALLSGSLGYFIGKDSR
jgi:hypothetical protein